VRRVAELSESTQSARKGVRGMTVIMAGLILVVLGFVVSRLITDIPNIATGTVPEDQRDVPYAAHPWLAYLHIVPGVVYLLGAPLQLWYGFRHRHYAAHRRIGRLVLASGAVSGVFAIGFGARYAFGGTGEASAALVFGSWFLLCLLLAYIAIRRGRVRRHRRWMIRAYAIAIGVGTIRLWVFLLSASGLMEFQPSFGVAFWLALGMHAVAAEWWLRARPGPPDSG
jgi:uncharacterized membrane protein